MLSNVEGVAQMNRQTQLAMKHEDERSKLHQQLQTTKAEASKMQQHIGEMTEKIKAEEEGKKVMMAQFQAQEKKVTQGLKDVQVPLQIRAMICAHSRHRPAAHDVIEGLLCRSRVRKSARCYTSSCKTPMPSLRSPQRHLPKPTRKRPRCLAWSR